MRKWTSVVLLSTAFASCHTANNRTALADAAVSQTPAKPNDLPASKAKFNLGDMKVLSNHGTWFCQKVKTVNSVEMGNLAKKLCTDASVWTGYVAADGLLNATELYIANRTALQDALANAASAAAKNGDTATQRRIFSESTILNQDMSLMTGDSMKAFEDEMQNPSGGSDAIVASRKAYMQFDAWVKSLNAFYRANPASAKAP